MRRLGLVVLVVMGCSTNPSTTEPDSGPNDNDGSLVDGSVDLDAQLADADPNQLDAQNETDGTTTTCLDAVCDLVPQCGCPGQACDVINLNTGARACRTAGVGVEGAVCSDDIDCGAGLACIDGLCAWYCNDSDDCTAPGGFCSPRTNGFDPVPGANVCSQNCDPIAQTPCVAGSGCYVFPDPMMPVDLWTGCMPEGNALEDGGCVAQNDCAAGLVCTTNGCQSFCETIDDCQPGKTCTGVVGKLGVDTIYHCE